MPTPPDPKFSPGFTRRAIIVYGAAMAALSHPLVGLADKAAEGNVARNLKQFTDLSSALTGRTQLNPITSERIFMALGGHQPELTDTLANLASVAGQNPQSWSDSQRAMARKILKAWYLGQVGDGPDAEVITYEHALMFEPVADALAPRTFCYRKPGYWAAAPDQA